MGKSSRYTEVLLSSIIVATLCTSAGYRCVTAAWMNIEVRVVGCRRRCARAARGTHIKDRCVGFKKRDLRAA